MNDLQIYKEMNKDLIKQFTSSYRAAQTNLARASMYAYQLKQESERLFYEYATTELNISRTTLTKMLAAGKLMIEKPESIQLPKAYSTVYELTKISHDLEGFNDFCIDDKKVKMEDLSNRQARQFIQEFIQEYEKKYSGHEEEKEFDQDPEQDDPGEDDPDEEAIISKLECFNDFCNIGIKIICKYLNADKEHKDDYQKVIDTFKLLSKLYEKEVNEG